MVGLPIEPDAGAEIADVIDRVSELERIVRERQQQTLEILDDDVPLGRVNSLNFLEGLAASREGTRGFVEGNLVPGPSTIGTGYSLVSVSVLPQGTAIYDPPDGINAILVECIGAGGGGGGTGSLALSSAAGGGGGGGGYANKWITALAATYVVVIGAGGAGGGPGNVDGANGGNTTFGTGPLCRAGGGVGGAGMGAGTTPLPTSGRAGGDADIGDVLLDGDSGEGGWRETGSVAVSGHGGTAARGGGGGQARAVQGDGFAGRDFGGGGSGACTLSGGAVQAGGDGADGLIIVREYVFGSGGGKEYATVVVAANNTHASGKAGADYVCDGVADDVEINAAIQDVIDLGIPGGRVQLLEGDYQIAGAGVDIPATAYGLELAGVGLGTRLHSAPAGVVVEVDGVFCGVRDMQVRGGGTTLVQLDGNDSWAMRVHAFQSVVGFRAQLGTRQRFIQCVAEDQSSAGFVISSSFVELDECEARDGVTGFSLGVGATNCGATNCGAIVHEGNGFVVDGARSRLLGCLAYECESNGIDITGNGAFAAIEDCTVYLCGPPGIPSVVAGIATDADGVQIVGNDVLSCSGHGIHVESTAQDCAVLGNYVANNGTGSHNTRDGIHVQGDQCNVQQNTVRRGGGAAQQRYGVFVNGAGASANLVTNNDLLLSGATASFNDTGAGTVTAAGNRL